ncbi:hypothetical protein HYW21_06315 [Candidatus Woesearchaeota archaeon]|nr:hypothetical protein [Candidatus Woesearchaeota archaeon]
MPTTQYNLVAYQKSVSAYSAQFQTVKLPDGKQNIFVLIPFNDPAAYYSLAPFSHAAHTHGYDLFVVGYETIPPAITALFSLWRTTQRLRRGESSPETKALHEFMNLGVELLGENFKELFDEPELILEARNSCFLCTNGSHKGLSFPHHAGWFQPYREEELQQTARGIWNQVFNLQPNERVGLHGELIPLDNMRDAPLEDYLDNFALVRNMAKAIEGRHAFTIEWKTSRASMVDKPPRIAELKTTLAGCELCKESDEEIFRAYNPLSQQFTLSSLLPSDAVFAIHGRGYYGKHLFGSVVGYPGIGNKTRWSTPSAMIYRFDWNPQTALDSREPCSRIGFTETIPIDEFIQTCNVDWLAMKKRNDAIKAVLQHCTRVVVEGESQVIKGRKFRTSFTVYLVGENGKRYWPRGSDIVIRSKIHQEYYQRTGIKAGTMANLPGGECFVTPAWMEGTLLGDCVICIDESIPLNPNDPFVVRFTRKGYEIIKGPTEVMKTFTKQKQDCWQRITEMEQHQSLPREIIEQYKQNMENVGEFAINTNPYAQRSRYLIVNEKLAGMIHVALGSGFEPERATLYHNDIVLDAQRQQLTITAVDEHGKSYPLMSKGKLLVGV